MNDNHIRGTAAKPARDGRNTSDGPTATPAKAGSNTSEASLKDFCEHIRNVHLSLLGICLLLIGVLIRSEPRPLSTAIADLETISKLDTAKINAELHASAEKVFNSYSQKNQQQLQLGRPSYILVYWLDGTKKSFRLDYPIAWQLGQSIDIELKYGAQTPEEFKDFWDACLISRIEATPAFAGATRIRFTDSAFRLPSIKGLGIVYAPPIEGKVLVQATDFDSFVKGVHTGASSKEIKSHDLLNPLPLKVQFYRYGESNTLQFRAAGNTEEIELDLPEVNIKFDTLAAFLKASGVEGKWKHAPFEQAFGELSIQMSAISGLTLKDAKDYVDRQSALTAPEDMVDVFGAKLPAAKVSNWGIIIILGVQFYLLILAVQLVTLLPLPPSGTLTWSGLFPGPSARGFTLISSAVLPVAVLLYIELQKWPANMTAKILYISGLTFSLVLGLGMVAKLREVWRNRTAA